MNINLIIKGILVGIAKIIPGFSGSVLMMSLGLYDKAITAITTFKNNLKENFLFLLNLSIGIIIGIILFSNIINYLLNNYYLYTNALFIGLILGGMTNLKREVNKREYLYIIISAIICLIISCKTINNNYTLTNTYRDYFIFIISGLLEGLGTIIPGISSTSLLMQIGIYKYYLERLSTIININLLITNLKFFIPFTFSFSLSLILISLVIKYLFDNYKSRTIAIIIGISLSSIIINIIKIIPIINILSVLLFIISYVISKYFIS